jgi:hypothetical protein
VAATARGREATRSRDIRPVRAARPRFRSGFRRDLSSGRTAGARCRIGRGVSKDAAVASPQPHEPNYPIAREDALRHELRVHHPAARSRHCRGLRPAKAGQSTAAVRAHAEGIDLRRSRSTLSRAFMRCDAPAGRANQPTRQVPMGPLCCLRRGYTWCCRRSRTEAVRRSAIRDRPCGRNSIYGMSRNSRDCTDHTSGWPRFPKSERCCFEIARVGCGTGGA